MAQFKENTHIDDWYRYKEPLPRSEWKSTRVTSTGSGVELRSNFFFDINKCPHCGGKGLKEVKAPKGRKRFVMCDCKYGKQVLT